MNITVTVLCLTYNQAGCIREALEGFVAQRPPFAFEVLVHDDASTDGTADIVREYEARYPALIRGVYQQQNQYSQGVFIAREFLFPLIRGRYVALCEGDDYWTDPDKLAKQVAALEAHPELDICSHRALCIRGGAPHGYVAPRLRDAVIPAGEVILEGGNAFATASLLCRRDVYMRQTPMRDVLVNDYVLQMQGSLRGGMLYLDDCMSVYRMDTPGSWTGKHGRWLDDDHRKLLNRMLDALDAYTDGAWHREITLRKRIYDSNSLLASHRYAALLAPGEIGTTLHRLRLDAVRDWRKLCLWLRKMKNLQ